MSNKSNVGYKERELREKDPNANLRICFEVPTTALRPHLHTEGFQLITIGSSTKGHPPRYYNLQHEVYNSNSQTPLHERVGTK